MEIKFSYNPFTKEFIQSRFCLHASDLRGKTFKDYIRGVIFGKVLYLRAFYPFDPADLQGESLESLYSKSARLLKEYEPELLKAVRRYLKIKISRLVINADQDLKGKTN